MIYKFADFYFDITSRFSYFASKAVDYVCADAPQVDFSIAVSDDELQRERDLAAANGLHCPRSQAEYLAIYRKICALILPRGAFLMHGVALAFGDRGFIFTAKSGTGKTTHVRLWQQEFGKDNAVIINGDKPLIRLLDGRFYAYGTPWNGKEGYGQNLRTQISAVAFIERAAENSIVKIPTEDAVARIFSQIMITDSTDLPRQLELLDQFVSRIPFYLIRCNMDPAAAHIAHAELMKV